MVAEKNNFPSNAFFYQKKLLKSLEQIFSNGGYRNINRFDFQVLRECSSWASRNGAVWIFFQTPTRNMFLAVLQEYVFYNLEWVEVRKMNEAFERNCIVKWVIFFASFCWLWDFVLENPKLTDKHQIWGF